MSQFTPRSGKSGYIKPRGKHFYYRRVIPAAFRDFFDGKTEWNIKLESTTDAGRKAEAGALAHRHNKTMTYNVIEPYYFPDSDYLAMRIDVAPISKHPLTFYRDGQTVETYKVAISEDPEFLKLAEKDGFFAVTRGELLTQMDLSLLNLAAHKASGDALELNELKASNIRRDIDELTPAGSDTLRTILPKMHEQNKPRESTKTGHYRVIEEFIDLHGNISLRNITKGHVAGYVAHMGSVEVNGQLLAPTTVKQRLEKLVAVLQFAASIDAVEYNVGKVVNAPKDTRPLGDQVYKAFSKLEVRNLVGAATAIWTKRRYQNQKTQMSRMTDSITALYTLIWTGARPEEVCQLRLEDVDLDQKGIVITNVSDDLTARNRILKNEESVRGVPIHRALLPRLSDHIDHVRKVNNSGLLFPSFEPSTETGRYARPIGSDWSQFLPKHVSNDPQKVLYSLRHSWAGESAAVGMSETMRNSIMGHASDSASSSAKRYRHHFIDLENQLEWVDKMDCLND